MSQRAGYDAIASAMSGLMHITGPEVGILRIFLFIFLIHARNKIFFIKLTLNEFWKETVNDFIKIQRKCDSCK